MQRPGGWGGRSAGCAGPRSWGSSGQARAAPGHRRALAPAPSPWATEGAWTRCCPHTRGRHGTPTPTGQRAGDSREHEVLSPALRPRDPEATRLFRGPGAPGAHAEAARGCHPGGPRGWAALTELGFSPTLASTYVSVLGSTASSASRIFSTGMSSLALLVDSTSFSLRSLPRCRSSCTAENRVCPPLTDPVGGCAHRHHPQARHGQGSPGPGSHQAGSWAGISPWTEKGWDRPRGHRQSQEGFPEEGAVRPKERENQGHGFGQRWGARRGRGLGPQKQEPIRRGGEQAVYFSSVVQHTHTAEQPHRGCGDLRPESTRSLSRPRGAGTPPKSPAGPNRAPGPRAGPSTRPRAPGGFLGFPRPPGLAPTCPHSSLEEDPKDLNQRGAERAEEKPRPGMGGGGLRAGNGACA